MVLAVEKYGGVKGFFMGIWRILRCNPHNKQRGIDYP
jgi:putative component of membrane protein insertase Oxa1/YidC/SpoIIIJ protein YidD